MENLQTKTITCSNCNYQMEYWTLNTFIECPKCKARNIVEPCEEIEVKEVEEEIIEE